MGCFTYWPKLANEVGRCLSLVRKDNKLSVVDMDNQSALLPLPVIFADDICGGVYHRLLGEMPSTVV
jgi:hypothetical protein